MAYYDFLNRATSSFLSSLPEKTSLLLLWITFLSILPRKKICHSAIFFWKASSTSLFLFLFFEALRKTCIVVQVSNWILGNISQFFDKFRLLLPREERRGRKEVRNEHAWKWRFMYWISLISRSSRSQSNGLFPPIRKRHERHKRLISWFLIQTSFRSRADSLAVPVFPIRHHGWNGAIFRLSCRKLTHPRIKKDEGEKEERTFWANEKIPSRKFVTSFSPSSFTSSRGGHVHPRRFLTMSQIPFFFAHLAKTMCEWREVEVPKSSLWCQSVHEPKYWSRMESIVKISDVSPHIPWEFWDETLILSCDNDMFTGKQVVKSQMLSSRKSLTVDLRLRILSRGGKVLEPQISRPIGSVIESWSKKKLEEENEKKEGEFCAFLFLGSLSLSLSLSLLSRRARFWGGSDPPQTSIVECQASFGKRSWPIKKIRTH